MNIETYRAGKEAARAPLRYFKNWSRRLGTPLTDHFCNNDDTTSTSGSPAIVGHDQNHVMQKTVRTQYARRLP